MKPNPMNSTYGRITPLENTKKPFSLARLLKIIFVTILCLILSIIFLFPVVWMVSNSFKDHETVYAQMTSIMTFLPPSINVGEWFVSYVKLFQGFDNFGQSVLNSIIYATVTIVSVLVINSLAGYALARFKFPGNKAMTTIILLLMIIPIETSVVPMYLILYYLGLLKEPFNIVGYLIPGFASLFYTYMFRQYFLGMPIEVEEAARIDGCSRVGVFFKMIVPLAKPIFATVAIFTFMGQWNEYIFAQLMFPNPAQQPLQVFLQLVNNANPQDIGMVMASLTLSTIPIALVYIFAQRYIVEGVAFTGLK
jgi:ABC-type glycerol-3-phosphate transport system permease component